MKQYFLFLAILIICQGCNTHGSQKQTAQIFQPDIISVKDQHDDYISLNPDETFLTLTRFTDDYRNGTIYISQKLNGEWQEATVAPFSGNYNDSRSYISPDGKRIYYASNRPTKIRPNKKDLDIWYVELQNNEWSNPIHTGNIINSEVNETHPSISENGNLYFARWGRGTNNIYISKLENGVYQKPIIQPAISTNYSESHPFIDPKEQYILYGSARDSDGLDGEVYISVQKDGQWCKPEKLDIINSNLYDYSAKINYNRNKIYFSRTDFNKNGEPADIYRLDVNWDQVLQSYLENATFNDN
ncbi:hypothetical protein [uncultured Winogradskyella sp.]|uniref:TolB family protein n=1 Tax=uncultured Winogradskyella sp. TaxID=395353 RepID=UPI00262FB3A3|nr:hypothetical protein [uncultured Winogradskyella sp.]